MRKSADNGSSYLKTSAQTSNAVALHLTSSLNPGFRRMTFEDHQLQEQPPYSAVSKAVAPSRHLGTAMRPKAPHDSELNVYHEVNE